jgi:hypothetical protein
MHQLHSLSISITPKAFAGAAALTGWDPNLAAVSTNAPCVIRTHDRLLRRQLLYPAELREQGKHCAQPHGQGLALPVSILAGPSP